MFPREDALHRVSTEFRRHLAAPDPISSFYFWTRTRRDIGASAFGLLRPNGQTMFAPYLDADLFRFLASLPASMNVDHQFHTDTIARAYPEFNDVPYGQKNPTPRSVWRTEALAAMREVAFSRNPLIDKPGTLIRLIRSLLWASHAMDAFWLSRLPVYFRQISELQGKRL
jgi:hypothetical protein